ncbi:hypothetical protein [Aquamicrobium soli]|uniref:hypothetical protein n=1 Tax=Aquamicrobium soli TaxID=1811518 RepID=UPI00366ADE31
MPYGPARVNYVWIGESALSDRHALATIATMTANKGRDDYMAHKDSEANDAAAQRKARLAEALRANLQKRKAQARSRRAGQADTRPEGLGAGREEKE